MQAGCRGVCEFLPHARCHPHVRRESILLAHRSHYKSRSAVTRMKKRMKCDISVVDIALSSAPEVTSSYVTTWVRVGVNRARDLVRYGSFQRIPHLSVLFHRVLDDVFRQLLLVSIRFRTIPVPSVTRHSVEPSGYLVQYIRLSLSSLRRQVESPVQ